MAGSKACNLQSRTVLASLEVLTGAAKLLILLVCPVGLEPTTSSLRVIAPGPRWVSAGGKNAAVSVGAY